jgi:hypothetical protein
MTGLHTPHRNAGSSRYCGPTAIMAVTGVAGSDIVDAVRQVRGDILSASGARMPVSGMSNKDLIATMALLGWGVVEAWEAQDARLRLVSDPEAGCGRLARPEGFKPYPFSQFLSEHGNDGPFIVNVTGHYMAVAHGEVCDAAATVLPTDIDRYLKRAKGGYRNAWVWKWWKFSQEESAQ